MIFVELKETLRTWIAKMNHLVNRRIPYVIPIIDDVDKGSRKYYDQLLKTFPITKAKLPNPEYRIDLKKLFIENEKIMKKGYILENIDLIEEFIKGFHERKRIFISKWIISIEPKPDFTTSYVLYPVEIMYPSGFWENIEGEKFWEKIYFNEPVIRFSNI